VTMQREHARGLGAKGRQQGVQNRAFLRKASLSRREGRWRCPEPVSEINVAQPPQSWVVETIGCQPDVVTNDGSAWPRGLRLAQRDLGSVIGMMAGPGRSPAAPGPGPSLALVVILAVIPQATLHPTRPDSPESSTNLTWLDPTGPV
jgi:hypothetical protein